MIGTLERYFADFVVLGTILSVGTLLAIAFAAPWVIDRLPADYFSASHRHVLHRPEGAAGWMLVGLKNAAGAVLLALGLVMLVTPGQGLLTILVGLLLLNFPGKYHLEQALVRRDPVFDALNWLRARRGLPPFEKPPEPG